MYDELQLDTLGDKKTALFLIMSDTDSTFNFLISMVYTQLFNLLCDKADDVYGGKCILQLRGVRPFLSDKYDLTQHPNYKLTSDYDPKNTFDIEKYLNRKEKINPNDEFVVIDADSLPSA